MKATLFTLQIATVNIYTEPEITKTKNRTNKKTEKMGDFTDIHKQIRFTSKC